jgi:hypothetical protein
MEIKREVATWKAVTFPSVVKRIVFSSSKRRSPCKCQLIHDSHVAQRLSVILITYTYNSDFEVIVIISVSLSKHSSGVSPETWEANL